MPFQSFQESPDVPVTAFGFQQSGQPVFQPLDQAGVNLGSFVFFLFRKPDRIFQQTGQAFSKGFPGRSPVEFIDLNQFGEQVKETPLLGQGADFIVSAPEVTTRIPENSSPKT